MANKKIIVIPKELENASQLAKDQFVKWREVSEQLEFHELRYYSIVDKHGDSHVIDCLGVYKMNWIRMGKMAGIPKADFEEVKRRGLILHQLKILKGQLNRKWTLEAGLGKVSRNRSVFTFRGADMLEEFGKYKSIDQVHELTKEWGFVISKSKITEFYYDNKAEIDERRMRFVATEKDFYLATGTGRIESLSYLFGELMDLFDKTKAVKYATEIRAIIEQVRKEIKGDEIRLTVDGKIDISATVQANKTIQEINQRVPINMVIISLVAAKKGLNPADIMAQLTNSFYSNYNGFSKLNTDDEPIKLPSHFINDYDWNEIGQIHKVKEVEATRRLYEDKLSRFFKKEGVKYTGNTLESLRILESKLSGEAVPEIVDIEPLEISVVENKKQEVTSKRELLKQILNKRIKGDKEE